MTNTKTLRAKTKRKNQDGKHIIKKDNENTKMKAPPINVLDIVIVGW